MSPLKKPNSFEEKLKDQLDGMEWKPSESLWNRIEQNMSADSFEPTIQSKLENYQVTPTEKVWQNVEAQLPETKRKKGLFWFGSVALLLLATFGAGYWFSNISEPKSKPIVLSQTTNSTLDNQDPKSADRIAKGSNENLKNHAKPQNLNPQNPINSNQKVEVSINSNAITPEGLVQTEKKRPMNLNSSHTTSGTKSLNKANKKASPSVNAGSIANSGKLPPNRNEISSSENESIANNGSTALSNSVANVPLTGITSGNGGFAAKSDTSAKPSEPKVIQESANFQASNKDTFAEEKPFRGTSYIAPEESFTNFSLSVYAGMHMSFMKLSMPKTDNYNMQKSFDLREEMESPSLDFAGGLLLNYHFGKGWFVSSGIGIVGFKQKVSFDVMPANQSTPSYVQDKNLYVNLNDSIIVGSSNTLENKYSFTEIPIMVGYQFPSEGAFHFELMGGVSYGRLNLINAYMTDPGCIGILIVNDRESFPQFQNVFFASIAPSVSYKLNSSVELGLMPNAKLSLNNMVKNEQWVQQKPALIGLNFTLRKRF